MTTLTAYSRMRAEIQSLGDARLLSADASLTRLMRRRWGVTRYLIEPQVAQTRRLVKEELRRRYGHGIRR